MTECHIRVRNGRSDTFRHVIVANLPVLPEVDDFIWNEEAQYKVIKRVFNLSGSVSLYTEIYKEPW